MKKSFRLAATFNWTKKNLLLYYRWPWHLLFWIGYALFRFWPYYLTITYKYPKRFLEYMLLSELSVVISTYLTLLLYRKFFTRKKYFVYFLVGTLLWALLLYLRTEFQFFYLKDEPRFKGNNFADIFINNIALVVGLFLFVTTSKYFKDGYISQQFEAERRQQQLMAEVNNLKSQIAPHFLFNTLNNLYGLAVDKSDKLPALMLRLSDLLRHSLYETQKPLVPLGDEINVLKSYIELETVRLEDDLKLAFENKVPQDSPYQIAPLILIVFMENAFKHAKYIQHDPINIDIKVAMVDDWFSLTVRNNYKKDRQGSANGIGLTNVKRRLELLYPNQRHQLSIIKDDVFFTVNLLLQLTK